MRFAVLGQGSIGRRHARLLSELGHAVGVFDPQGRPPDAGAAGLVLYDSAEAALDTAEAALIASPTSQHVPQGRMALERGLPTLVEKPLATEPDGARQLEALAAARGAVLAVAMNLRFHPGPRTVRRLVAEGAVGRVLRADVHFGSWLPGWRPATDYRTGYSARADLGGGVLLDAVHEIDYLCWVLGPVARVAARLRHVSDLELTGVDDVATLNLELAGGAQATVTLDYLDRDYDRGCRIVGAEGTVSWSWARETVEHVAADGTRVVHPARNDIDATYREELRDFVTAVGRARPPATTAAEGRHAVEIVDAARRANAEGRVIDMPVAGPDRLGLRPATAGDRDRLRDWRNDRVMREASFSAEEVSAAEHAAWMARKLADPACRVWIAESDGIPVGQARAELAGDGCAELHIGLAAHARGRGLSAPMLELAVRRAGHELGARLLHARVKPGNDASVRAFERAGFAVTARGDGEIRLERSGS